MLRDGNFGPVYCSRGGDRSVQRELVHSTRAE